MRPAQGTGGVLMFKTLLVYVVAAGAEIGGCFGIWHWLRNGKSAWWAVPSVLSLVLFAWLLTHVEAMPPAERMQPTAESTSSHLLRGSGSWKEYDQTDGTF